MMCPSSCARMYRCSSRSSAPIVPELITMNGSSKPTAPAFTNGVWVTYSCGRVGQSRVSSTSVHRVELRSLPRPDADGVGEEELPDAPFTEEARDLPHDLVEHRDRAKRVER